MRLPIPPSARGFSFPTIPDEVTLEQPLKSCKPMLENLSHLAALSQTLVRADVVCPYL
ncbi:MAG: hypothetical protein ACAF41_25785 [Leptolyngbya sp. BL-A-14]